MLVIVVQRNDSWVRLLIDSLSWQLTHHFSGFMKTNPQEEAFQPLVVLMLQVLCPNVHGVFSSQKASEGNSPLYSPDQQLKRRFLMLGTSIFVSL